VIAVVGSLAVVAIVEPAVSENFYCFLHNDEKYAKIPKFETENIVLKDTSIIY
jgi:hypothetical protein